MKVLAIFTHRQIGGAERVILNLIKYREDPAIHYVSAIISDREAGDMDRELTELQVPPVIIPRGRMRNPLSLLKVRSALRRTIRDTGADVVLTHSSQGFVYARLAALGTGVPVGVYHMQTSREKLCDNNKAEIAMAKLQPAFMFTANKTMARFAQGWGVRNVTPVYHGTPERLPTDAERTKRDEVLHAHNIPADAQVVLLPGRLQPWKGQHVFIEAFAAVATANPRAHGVIVGSALFGLDEDYPEKLRALIAEKKLTGRVHMVGHQPLPAWFERAALVAHTSVEPDPFPNVCIEAMALSRAVITNELSGTSEIIVHGRNGMVVPAKNPEALASAILDLLRDPTTTTACGHEARQTYLTTCTPSHMVRPIENELKELRTFRK